MDYDELAVEFLKKMQMLHTAKPQKDIAGAVQGEAFILNYIAQHGSDVLPGEIGHEMDVSSARIATALNSLEKKGLITRQIDTNDRRKILVRITEKGKDLSEKELKNVTAIAAKMLSLLGEHDAKEYVRIMGRLIEIAPNCKELLIENDGH